MTEEQKKAIWRAVRDAAEGKAQWAVWDGIVAAIEEYDRQVRPDG